MSKSFRMIAPTTRQEHEHIFIHYMSLIEKIEWNDGSGEICDILYLDKVDTIIDIIGLDDEHIK